MNVDIGRPKVAGGATVAGDAFTVSGGGTDISGKADQFHFVYQTVDGDLELVARVATIQQVHPGSKAGVMIRAALTAGSAHAFMAGSAARGWAFHRRLTANGSSVQTSGSFASPPGWVKLVRTADIFRAYESIDGSTWVLVGTETIQMGRTVYVGLAVTSNSARAVSTATYTNVVVAPTAPPNEPPAVTLLAPASGTTYTAPANVAFQATASDTDGTVSRVDFFAGAQLIASDATSPYSAAWSDVPAGVYDLTAVAIDNAGASSTSSTARVTVSVPANRPPSVSITSPGSGISFTAPATVAITAAATDDDGTVARVDFYGGAALIGSDTIAPYTASWSNVAAGSYALSAVAFDNGGASTTSAAVSITVTGTSSTPTRVAFSASLDHATAVTSYSVALRRASDAVTAPPLTSRSLGKPAPVDDEIVVDISDIVNPLPAGSYYAVVTAIGSAGSSASAPSATFMR